MFDRRCWRADADDSTLAFLAEQLTADRYEVLMASEPAQVWSERRASRWIC